MSYFYSAFRSWCWSTPVIPLARNSPVDASTLRATPYIIAMTQIQLAIAIGSLKKAGERNLKPKKEKDSPTVMSELHTVFQKRSDHGSISGPINFPELLMVEENLAPEQAEEKPMLEESTEPVDEELESVEEPKEEEEPKESESVEEPKEEEEPKESESVEEPKEEEEPKKSEEESEEEESEKKPQPVEEKTVSAETTEPICAEISALQREIEAEPVLIAVST